MGKVLIYVEGQTEERFVRDVLAPHLSPRGVFPTPILARGLRPYTRSKRDIQHLLRDSSAVVVTTMLDYYGLPRDFPGRASPVGYTGHERVAHVEEQVAADIGDRKFKPYLQLHEFEALLFSAPSEIARALVAQGKGPELQRIRDGFSSPEEIDDDPMTAPSKRLGRVFGGRYQKALHGPQIAARIGLDPIRRECAHFDQWLIMLEELASP